GESISRGDRDIPWSVSSECYCVATIDLPPDEGDGAWALSASKCGATVVAPPAMWSIFRCSRVTHLFSEASPRRVGSSCASIGDAAFEIGGLGAGLLQRAGNALADLVAVDAINDDIAAFRQHVLPARNAFRRSAYRTDDHRLVGAKCVLATNIGKHRCRCR